MRRPSIYDLDYYTLEYLSKTPKERRQICKDTMAILDCYYFILLVGIVILLIVLACKGVFSCN